jgi:hypothetical protein
MNKLKEFADRITLKTGKTVPNPKIVLLTVLVIFGLIVGANKAYNHFQVAHIVNEAKILSAGGKYEEAVGVLLLAKDRWATNSLKREVVSELKKNRKLASVKGMETSKKDVPTAPSPTVSAPPPTSSNVTSKQAVVSDDPVIDCTSEKCGTKKLKTSECSKSVCCEVNGKWVWTYSSAECNAEQSKYQKVDYSYQIGWLNILIDGADEYINDAAAELKEDAHAYYDTCIATWDEHEAEYPDADTSLERAKCGSRRDDLIRDVDINIALFKHRKSQYEYLLQKFEAGNPNQADFGLYDEIVTEGR